MNQRNESNIRAVNLNSFQEMPTNLSQNIQNAQLYKQEDENSSGGCIINQNK